jgi:mannose-6-phosphate isomerase-like protein (cupin superfamily)
VRDSRKGALGLLVAILSGPITVSSLWVLAAAADRAGFVVLPDRAPRFAGQQGRESDITELLATREQTGGSLGIFRQTIAPNSGPPLHVHRGEDEFFYVVTGEFKLQIGDSITSAPAQSLMFVPKGTPHTFQSIGSESGVILVGVTPGGFEQRFADRQGVDAVKDRALMKKYKMEVVGPPLK